MVGRKLCQRRQSHFLLPDRARYNSDPTLKSFSEDEFKFDPFTGAPLDRNQNDVPIMAEVTKLRERADKVEGSMPKRETDILRALEQIENRSSHIRD